jgi:hypothetical protein
MVPPKGVNVDYLWAIVRTVAIVFAALVVALFVLFLASAVVAAFISSFAAGCVALAALCGLVSLFGHQLNRVARAPRTKLIGVHTCLWSGGVALLSLATLPAVYAFSSVVPLLINDMLQLPPFTTIFGTTRIDKAWIANLIFWPFIAYPCVNVVVSTWRAARGNSGETPEIQVLVFVLAAGLLLGAGCWMAGVGQG